MRDRSLGPAWCLSGDYATGRGRETQDRHLLDEQIAQFPEPIPSLRPNHLTIDEGRLKIEMMYMGWSSLGVFAYREGYPEYPPPAKNGDRKLLDGLWYYDDGYLGNPATTDTSVSSYVNPGRRRIDRGSVRPSRVATAEGEGKWQVPGDKSESSGPCPFPHCSGTGWLKDGCQLEIRAHPSESVSAVVNLCPKKL